MICVHLDCWVIFNVIIKQTKNKSAAQPGPNQGLLDSFLDWNECMFIANPQPLYWHTLLNYSLHIQLLIWYDEAGSTPDIMVLPGIEPASPVRNTMLVSTPREPNVIILCENPTTLLWSIKYPSFQSRCSLKSMYILFCLILTTISDLWRIGRNYAVDVAGLSYRGT